MRKFKLYFYTIKYLKCEQIYFRIYYLIRGKVSKKEYKKGLKRELKPIIWNDFLFNEKSYFGDDCFKFLNIKHCFNKKIDWNYLEYGKLWTFNLNYFDFLNQEGSNPEQGIRLINDFITNDATLKEGKESYTISLRGINWIKFLSKHNIINQEIDQKLYNHFQRLLDNLELQFLGNHYLENGFALLFGAYYFQDNQFYLASKKILNKELEEQVLADGAHIELSPMYHQTMLHRVLDCIHLMQNNNLWEGGKLLLFLKNKAKKMLSWLQSVTFKNGNIPMVNDSAFGIAPSSEALFKYATFLGISWEEGKLLESGYRKIEKGNYELFLDVGEVGASYLPAHIHSDTFNFELYVDKKPIIVDTGTSTYEKNELRQLQRSTKSHNTVQINSIEQSEIWGGFRVARRAKIVNLIENEKQIEATHDGYKKLNILHTRNYSFKGDKISITDLLSKVSKFETNAFFHFHPECYIEKSSLNNSLLINDKIKLDFNGDIKSLEVLDYEYCIGFNQTKKANFLKISFDKRLETQIYI
ncbi:alginate lyase family protein [Gaetbulibacter aestuarii]|uniref:Alginate lyase family protein n=1 Tax=Gaetbulibacter aestuarii TaxID=1502358 RepID=A0ABW7MUQ9_9FLAO